MTLHSSPHALTPTILVLLDGDVRPLAPRTTLAVARRSPAAARLFTGVDLVGRSDAFPDLLRKAVERVTDLGARSAVLRAGHSVRDELLFVLAFTLGSPLPEPEDIQSALEALLRAGNDFYRGSRIDIHAAVLLPDLAEERESRYRQAYAQLAALEAADAPGAPRMDGRPLLARRWICDCRTEAGAYAGRVGAVLDPLAESFAALIVGDAARAVDSELEPALHGAHHERLTRYSAPGFAELVFAPRVLARYMACRLGAELLEHGTRVPEPSARAAVEREAEEYFRALQPAAVADGLLPALEDAPSATEEGRSHHEHARRIRRAEARAAALDRALGAAREVTDQWGGHAAERFVRALVGPVQDPLIGPIHSEVNISRADAEARTQLREHLRVDARRAEAEALEEEAEYRDGRCGPDEGPDPAAQEMRARAAILRAEAVRLDALTRGNQFDELEAELLRALDTGDGVPVASEDLHPPRPTPPVPTPGPVPVRDTGGVRGWVRRLFARGAGSRAGEVPAQDADPLTAGIGGAGHSPPAASATPEHPGPVVVGGSNPRLLVEWLRWLDEYRGDLEQLRREVDRWGSDAAESAAYYARERDRLLDELTEDRRFGHRLLSKNACSDLYAARRDALRSVLHDTAAMPLSRFLVPDLPPLKVLERPLNIRFDGFDERLTQVAEAHLADWLEKDVEDVLFHDPGVTARFDPAGRLRAVADAARPMVRPDVGIVPPVRADVVSLPRPVEASETHLAWDEVGTNALFIDGHDPTRLTIRSVAHGFPVHGLRQLRAVRGDHPAPDVGDSNRDPLPHAVLVDASMEEVLSLGFAFGVVREENGQILLPGLVIVGDTAMLAHRLVTTFDGARCYHDLQHQVACLLREPTGVTRLREHEAAGARPEHRAALRRVLAHLEAGAWPASLPFAGACQ